MLEPNSKANININLNQINSKQSITQKEEIKSNKEKNNQKVILNSLNNNNNPNKKAFNLSNKIPSMGKYQNFSKKINPFEQKSFSKDNNNINNTIGKNFNLNNGKINLTK
jgi:hypothetical protein